MEALLKKFDGAKTFEEQCDYAREWIEAQSWGGFLKWGEFTARDLILFYPCMEDEDTTIWKDNTPAEEKETGKKAIEYIVSKLVSTVT